MNLHSVVGPIVGGTVNPMIVVGLQVSVGYTKDASFKRVPLYASPGRFSGSLAGTGLTADAVYAGVLQVGQSLLTATPGAPAVLPGTIITGLLDGVGQAGGYTVNQAQPADFGGVDFTTFTTLTAQLQPLTSRDLRMLDGLNLQGDVRALYVNGPLDGVLRPALKGGDLVTFPDGTVWLITQPLEKWNATAGWTKVAITLQTDAMIAAATPVPQQSDAQPAGAP